MKECETKHESCQLKGDFRIFDEYLHQEIRTEIDGNHIVNQSEFCTSIYLDLLDLGGLTILDYLRGVRGKTGLYFLWIDANEHCDVHDVHKLTCAYVGEGIVDNRLKDHIKSKWPEDERLMISFYECTKRMARYLEQLFLDCYKFHLNKNNNSGVEYLYGHWDGHRFDNGTETQAHGDILVRKLNLNTEY